MPDGSPWPRISIVTPSYNQGRFIEETMRSVLLQGYPDLEYIVMDGGSTDHTVEIIRPYEPWLAYWVSERDRGQTQAINKGMERATGEIVAWLNSDDLYLPGALARVASVWEQGQTHWLVGKVVIGKSLGSPDNQTLRISSSRAFLEIAGGWLLKGRHRRTFTQPEVFISRRAWTAVGGLFERLSLLMDYHLWAKLSAQGYAPRYVPEAVAFFRLHESQKTQPSTSDYHIRARGERSWALYDALRLGRSLKTPPPDLEQVAALLDVKGGGCIRVLDAFYRNQGWLRMASALIWSALFRPSTTLTDTPRAIIGRLCLNGKRHDS
jgi:glycosyltransferase involved in cell wall biosynthesis